MAVLGKRKASEPSISQKEANEIFRRHFESRFAPIQAQGQRPTRADEGGDGDGGGSSSEDGNGLETRQEEGADGEESEWEGLSDDEIDDDHDDGGGDDDGDGTADMQQSVEVVDHSGSQTPNPSTMSRRELKAFMSSRPPDQTASPPRQDTPSQPAASSTLPEDAPSLLAQDLELRRLLAESHLLSRNTQPFSSLSANAVAPKPFADGRTRLRAVDLRIRALGSSLSLDARDDARTPMKIRRGIAAAAAAREAKRRRDARQNGVILERDTAPAAAARRRRPARHTPVDRPAVGRLKGAELRLSERDVRSIEGGRDAFGRRSKR